VDLATEIEIEIEIVFLSFPFIRKPTLFRK
jgi:hypothetical protein